MEGLNRPLRRTENDAGRLALPAFAADLLWSVPALFLARIPVFLNLYILGPAYLCLLTRRPARGRLGALWCLLGILSMYREPGIGKYGILVLAVWATEEWLRHGKKRISDMGRSLLLALMLPAAALLSAWIFKSGYSFLLILVETGMFWIWIFLYQMGADALRKGKTAGWMLSEEEQTMALSACLGSFLAILPWDVAWKAPLLFFTMAASYGRGIGYGLLVSLPAAAVLRILGVSGESLLLLCVFCAVLCSFFRELGRATVVLANLVGGVMILLLYQGQVVLWEIVALLAAGLAFLWVPASWYEKKLWGPIWQEASGTAQVRTMQQHVNQMLARSAASMEEMGEVLRETTGEETLDSLDTGRILEDLAERVCGSCPGRDQCWGGHFSETYETIEAIMEAARSKGIIEKKDVPLYFLNRCQNSEEFIRRTNRHYELYRLNLSWENRMRRSAAITADQLHHMADMLQNMRNYLCAQLELDQNLSQRVQEEWTRGSLPILRTQVLKDLKTDRYTLHLEARVGHSQKLKHQLEARLESMLERPVQVTGSRMIKQGLWDWQIEETCRLRVESSVLSKGKERVNGDSTWMGRLPGGRYAVAISDGMGIGSQAGGESERALRILRLLLEAGAEEEEAIRLLNSMLLLCGDGEHFSTIDLVVMNLYTGSVHIAKAGSAATILKKQGRIQVYRSDNVPVGIMEKAEWEAFQDHVEEGDWIVLASDGVFDQQRDSESVERKIRAIMLRQSREASAKMAQSIYDAVCSGWQQEDDMTIITVRIQSNLRS